MAASEMITALVHKLRKNARRSRKIHCFCLGAAKTGTTSFAAMFERCYRSAHEPDTQGLTEAVAKILDANPNINRVGNIDILRNTSLSFDVAAWLRNRDQNLNLEVEASHPLGYLAPWLPEVFPQARFVITIRDPLNWLKSRLNFHYYKSPSQWQNYRTLIWRRWHKNYHAEEKVLEGIGLYSVDAYLGQYSEQYEILVKSLPEHRRLVVKTEELDTSIEEIAAFLKIDAATITPRHVNAFSHEESIIDRLPQKFISQRIEANCGWLKTLK